MTPICIFGHQKPDSDSIASVIGYAEFLNRDFPGRAIPARCGEFDPESRWMLRRFGVAGPVLVESVEPRLSDITYKPVFSLHEDVPTIDVAALMAKEGIRNVVITDKAGRPVGMIGEHALAGAYLRKIHISELTVTPIPVETLARILSAEIRVAARKILEGRVYIAIDALHVTLAKMTKNDIAVVGDDEPAQLAFISAGIACLIIAEGAPVGDRVLSEAKKRSVSVLSTDLDAFGVGKMINLTLPAREVMETEVPVLRFDDTLARARKVVSSSKFRAACVVAKEGTLAGVLTRTTLLDDVRKPVILLDHNEASQAVEGIGEAEIIEIIDHHRLGTITTLKPIRFLNDPVGSTSTIIAMKFRDSGRPPTKAVAGILLCGVLSDTLGLRMSTTTATDRDAVEYLAKVSSEDPGALGIELLEQGMDLSGVSLATILSRDTKVFDLSGQKVIISQVMVPSFSWNTVRAEEIQKELLALQEKSGADIVFALFTSVMDNASDCYGAGDPDLLTAIFGRPLPVHLDGVMSRKKDFLPWLGETLRTFAEK
ncbi:putative manganese-dependent inorganic diphosphatase [Methanoregula sp.]|uniref:putative manganese-dependent inorganic diphosphatase n=1 Tax=Methanoregula sp. TaxID=2052170 RepID=UPI00261DA09A|nr:putative manganese-dependent inorganic diphosphatase [Methanoregula sp.]MDD5142970.1 putative manganese-dependent inorganic diphosphatase [Methanoregula sp.]